MKTKLSTFLVALGLGLLLILLGFQAEPITGTIGVAFGILLSIASIYSWTKSS